MAFDCTSIFLIQWVQSKLYIFGLWQKPYEPHFLENSVLLRGCLIYEPHFTDGNYTCSCNSGFRGDGISCYELEVLVLKHSWDWKNALVINSAGEQKVVSCFEKDDSIKTDGSCSINWQNELFLFGGWSNQIRKIIRLVGYKLEDYGVLSFDHRGAGCSVMNNDIFLCFNSANTEDYKLCRRSSGPLRVCLSKLRTP